MILMKKFLSTMAMFSLLVQVVLPGAVAAQEAETKGVETSVVQQTQVPPVVENTGKSPDTSTSDEGAQNEEKKSESFLDKVGETLSQLGDAVGDITDDIKEEVKEAVEATKELISDVLGGQEKEKKQTSTDENPAT